MFEVFCELAEAIGKLLILVVLLFKMGDQKVLYFFIFRFF